MVMSTLQRHTKQHPSNPACACLLDIHFALQLTFTSVLLCMAPARPFSVDIAASHCPWVGCACFAMVHTWQDAMTAPHALCIYSQSTTLQYSYLKCTCACMCMCTASVSTRCVYPFGKCCPKSVPTCWALSCLLSCQCCLVAGVD